jgi:metallo-beta-lactamase class B
MKRALFLLSFGILNLTGMCQIQDEIIAISKDLELIKITENAYLHVSYANLPEYGRVSANGLVFIHGKNAFLFDTPWTDSLTKDLISYLRDRMGLNIRGFIPNHWHSDCMGGLGYLLSQNIETYANQKTIEIARKEGLPVAAHSFQDSLRLFLDDKIIECYFPGAAHSKDNIVVWIPSEKILFPGCMVKSLYSTDLGNVADGDLKSYPATIDNLIKKFKTAEIVIPGHGKAGGLDLLHHTMDLLQNI